jgi:hypothetical protein
MQSEAQRQRDAERYARLQRILSGQLRQQILASDRHTRFDAKGEAEAVRIAHEVEQQLTAGEGRAG